MKETFQPSVKMDMELEIQDNLEEYRNQLQGLKSESEFTEDESTESAESNEDDRESFGGVTLEINEIYEVPGISESAKNIKNKQFPGVIFGDCRLSKKLGTVVYSDSLVIPKDGTPKKEIHKETFYSQKRLPGGKLTIPGRHVAEDGTIRDKDGYICVAANYIPKGSQIMTTLGPGKVYDTGRMRGKRIDIYVNW